MKKQYQFLILLLLLPAVVWSQEKYVEIDWKKDPVAEKYLVQISKDREFLNIIHEEKTKELFLRLSLGGEIQETYFARVAGIGKYDIQGEFSKPFQIQVLVTEKFQPVESDYFVTNETPFGLETGDSDSGLSATYFKVNDDPWTAYTGPIYFHQEGPVLLSYYSVDNSGNREPVQSVEFFVDSVAPRIHIEPKNFIQEGSNYFSGKQSSFTVTATDRGSGVALLEYSWGVEGSSGTKFHPVPDGPIEIPGSLHDKSILLTIRSTDKLGNRSEKIFTFIHDAEGPKITTDLPAGKNLVSEGYSLKVFSEDLQSGVKWVQYSVNGSSMKFYSDSITLSEPGKIDILLLATDNVGNSTELKLPTVQVIKKQEHPLKIRIQTAN